MRTQSEIMARIEAIKGSDWLGTQVVDLAQQLPFDTARKYLDLTPEDEAKWHAPDVRAEMAGYIAFAWGKCTGHRGISAGRSLDHYRAWCWLIGDDEALAFIDDDANYAPYGAPVLAYLCRRYGWAIPDGDDVARMVAGESCRPDCDDGCSR